ncbi:MAG TPA: CCA tRNA nucleotidyltransferase [Actinomycetota bacterium]|jgi:poly(A) polymerase|nr:CCA tRNA nucleotidyltransferase [Actinomycetota bacterium]
MTEPTRPQPGARLDVHPLATELGERFRAAGFQLYLVGGVVRDLLLGRVREGAELDMATDATPTQTTRVLRGWADRRYLAGARFGTVGARKGDTSFEITTFRQEVYHEEHRRPSVTFAKDLETDLVRRDFTINAMAIGLPGGGFVDPCGGVRALAARRLDTPLDPEVAFSDDPLRMLRAARFLSQLEVTPTPRVVQAIRELRDRLDIVSAERISDELSKLLVGSRPSKGLDLVVSTGLAERFLPELPALTVEQDPVHKHKDVLRHTYAVVERCEPDLVLRLAALLHDIGKPKTRRIGAEGVSFHHHEVVGARMARERLVALRYPSAVVEDVVRLVEMHLRFHGYSEWTDSAVRRYVREAGPLLDRLNQLTRADCTTRNPFRARQLAALQDDLEERIARLGEEENLQAIRAPLDGNQVMEHLGLAPGPEVGRALAYLLDERMERGPIEEDEAYRLLDAWAKERGIARRS